VSDGDPASQFTIEKTCGSGYEICAEYSFSYHFCCYTEWDKKVSCCIASCNYSSEVDGLCGDAVCHGQGGHSPGKPGIVREFKSGQGKVRENVFLHVATYRAYIVLDPKCARKKFFTNLPSVL